MRPCWPPLRAPGTGGLRPPWMRRWARCGAGCARSAPAPALTARGRGRRGRGRRPVPRTCPRPRAGRALPEAVSALGAAARAFALSLSTPRPPGPGGPLSGVDYLTASTERHRHHLRRRLRLADPSGAVAALRGWALANLITGGRLLTSTAPG